MFIVYSASEDKSIKIWNADTGVCLSTLHGHSKGVSCIALTSDNSKIVSGSWDTNMKIWDVWSGKCLNTLKGHNHWIRCVAISPDGSKIVSGWGNRQMWVGYNVRCQMWKKLTNVGGIRVIILNIKSHPHLSVGLIESLY